jgi:hypothetical protein
MNKSIEQKVNINKILMNQDYTKENTHQQNKWITFTFFGHKTEQTVKIFKDADTRMAFKTIITIQKHLQPK